MTIQFNCPHCGSLIAFADKHVGKRARCTTCGQRFIIPAKSNETPQKVEEPEEEGEPLPGFYRAVFIESWKLFIRRQSATGLVFVTAAVCFKFFTGHTDYSFTMGAFRFQAPTGLVITLVAWGCLFWYYMEVICSTVLDAEELPQVDMDGFFSSIWNAIVSLFAFARAMVIVLLPSAMYLGIAKKADFVWYILVHFGLLAFPLAILTFSLGRDVGIRLRLDQILRAVTKALRPYLVIFGLFALAWELQLRTFGYERLLDADYWVMGLHLLANLAVQVIAIIAMRSIGLYWRHYIASISPGKRS